jgi:hypothetical protein
MNLGKLVDFNVVEDYLRRILRAVSYARTVNDQLRVNVDNQPGVYVYMGNSSTSIQQAGLQVTAYANNSWNIDDAREIARRASEQQWAITRQRWTIT